MVAENGWYRADPYAGFEIIAGFQHHKIGLSFAPQPKMEIRMKICPVAIAVGCKRCPIFKICPVKDIIGDQVKPAPKAVAKAKTNKRR